MRSSGCITPSNAPAATCAAHHLGRSARRVGLVADQAQRLGGAALHERRRRSRAPAAARAGRPAANQPEGERRHLPHLGSGHRSARMSGSTPPAGRRGPPPSAARRRTRASASPSSDQDRTAAAAVRARHACALGRRRRWRARAAIRVSQDPLIFEPDDPGRASAPRNPWGERRRGTRPGSEWCRKPTAHSAAGAAEAIGTETGRCAASRMKRGRESASSQEADSRAARVRRGDFDDGMRCCGGSRGRLRMIACGCTAPLLAEPVAAAVYSRVFRSTSPSRGRLASARPRSPNVSPRRLDAASCSTIPRIRFSPISTPGVRGAALQSQLFYLLDRHRQQLALRQADPLQPDDRLRLPVRQGQDLRVSEPRRQRAVHLSAAVRPARPRRAAARSRRLPAGADRGAAQAAARDRPRTPNAEPRVPDPREYLKELNEAYQPLLLPLHGHAAARGRNLPPRFAPGRRRRSTICCGRSSDDARARAITCRAEA